MRIVTMTSIPDRSGPGLTTTATGAVDLQGTGGNWTTVGRRRRRRGGRCVRRQREKRKSKNVGLTVGTLNVGTMTGKARELIDMMQRRKVDILCVQETRWKGSKARSVGAGFKLFYHGSDRRRNGVGVILKEELVRNVLEVIRVSDRLMSLELEIEGVMFNVVSGYAPQVGCEFEEKEKFWSELDEVMQSIPTAEGEKREEESENQEALDKQSGHTAASQDQDLGERSEKRQNKQLYLEHMCKAMLQRTGPHLLLLIALCSVLYSRTLSLPYTSMRPTRHADGLFTSGYSKLLGQLSARRYLESLIGKRVSDELMEEPVKRHSDAIFTDNYSRFRKQMAVKKYLNSVLTGKRSLEDPGTSDTEETRDEPNTFQESYDDINIDHLLNNIQLPL
ncbi:hypothetical protein Q8A73_001143 [Channa argus]|nr:hypothetical protein Q8A73_001143 [Channa argus]